MSPEKKSFPLLSKTYLQPHRLEHFLSLYETLNMHKAAARGNVTQQAVSKSLAKLEDMLQVKLFERHPTGVSPTFYANHLARRAKLILAESRLATMEIESLRGSKYGNVRVGCGPSITPRIFPLAFERLRLRNSDIGIKSCEGHTQRLAPLVSSGEIDFAVTAPPDSISLDPELNIETVHTELDFIVGKAEHPLLDNKNRTLEDYLNFPWVGPLGLPDAWATIVDMFSSDGVDPPSNVILTDSTDVVIGHMIESNALCLIPLEIVFRHIQAGFLNVISHPKLIQERRIIVLTRKRSPLSPAAHLLKTIIIETIKNVHSERQNDPKYKALLPTQ